MSKNDNFTPQDIKHALQEAGNKAPDRLPNFGGRVPKEITPPNFLKQKVGSGGLDEKILEKAQKLVEKNTVDFKPYALEFLDSLESTIAEINNSNSAFTDEDCVNMMLYSAVQLKANGGMFRYQLVTEIADLFTRFLETLKAPKSLSQPALEMINGFYTSLKAIIYSEIKGNGGTDGQELLTELKAAWQRYLDKKKKP